MEEIVAVEQRRKIRETPLEKFWREIGRFGVGLIRLALLALILTPILLAAFLTLDLPIRSFDALFDTPSLKPSNWLTYGNVLLCGAALVAILVGRRFGADEASRAITAAWGLAAVLVFAELTHLAPRLQDSDFPSVRFVVSFVASAMIGQYVAVGVYDIVRGGGAWWRAPLISALVAFATQSLIFHVSVYWSANAPWINWMIADFGVKAIIAFGFLGIYRLLQDSIRPLRGLGR